MKKFKGKYRTDSLRLQGYDYSKEGLYFITICTRNHKSYLGVVEEDKMILSEAGKIVANEWQRTAAIRDRVQLGEWVVMPNHVHGIIYLKPKKSEKISRDASYASRDRVNPVKTRDECDSSLQSGYKNEFGPQRDNISSIVRGFKAACFRRIVESGQKNFRWQSGFHDHIIRNQKSLLRIEQYILENPYHWNDDRYYC